MHVSLSESWTQSGMYICMSIYYGMIDKKLTCSGLAAPVPRTDPEIDQNAVYCRVTTAYSSPLHIHARGVKYKKTTERE